MAATDGAHGAGILDGIRIVDLSDGIAGPVATLMLAEAGADVVAVEPPGGAANRATTGFHTWMRSKRSVVLDLDAGRRPRRARPPARRRRRRRAQPRTDARPRARARRRVVGDAVPAADRVVGAGVAHEPRRRRPARRRAARRWRASGCSTSSRASATDRSSSAARSRAGARRTSRRSASSPGSSPASAPATPGPRTRRWPRARWCRWRCTGAGSSTRRRRWPSACPRA